MSTLSHDIVVVLQPPELFSLDMLASRAELHPAVVRRYVELGLVCPCKRTCARVFLCQRMCFGWVQSAACVTRLGINLAGIAVVLDLIDHIAALQFENEQLRRRH
jgi:chaperone modulatory protein CbpM